MITLSIERSMTSIITKIGNWNILENRKLSIIFEETYWTCLMRGLDATQQTSPKPLSRMSVETTHPPNEHDNIFKQLDKHVCGVKLETYT